MSAGAARGHPELEKRLKHLAYRAHNILNVLDVSRTDIRLDEEGNPRLIEINTLPGLTPNYSDLCLQAAAEGISHTDLVLDILYLAAGRWGMLEPRELERLKSIRFDQAVPLMLDYWRERLAARTQVSVPDAALNDFYRANLWHILITTERDPVTGLYHQGVGKVRYRVFAMKP